MYEHKTLASIDLNKLYVTNQLSTISSAFYMKWNRKRYQQTELWNVLLQ